MKKKLITISILVIVLVIGIIINNNNNNTNEVYITTSDDTSASIALVVDGEVASSFPSKGKYTVDVSCSNADGVWDYDEWKLDISNLTGGTVSCNVTFTTVSTTYLNNYIISLSGTTQGDGEVVNENGYRYQGKDPNNYIWYNNELWRIIGVFDSDSHGVSNTNLVKIIRTNSIGGLTWNKSGTNDWTTSSLNYLLNRYYYYSLDGTDSGYCYGYASTIATYCDYSNIGLTSAYRSMVEEVTWYLGGYSSASATADSFYEYERSGEYVYNGRSTNITGYLGLIYASDYGYSVLSSDCDRTILLDAYVTNSCVGKSWIYTNNSNYTWTITPYSGSSSRVFDIIHSGDLGYDVVANGFSVRPTLYLSSSVYILDGTGSIEDPYIIAMD